MTNTVNATRSVVWAVSSDVIAVTAQLRAAARFQCVCEAAGACRARGLGVSGRLGARPRPAGSPLITRRPARGHRGGSGGNIAHTRCRSGLPALPPAGLPGLTRARALPGAPACALPVFWRGAGADGTQARGLPRGSGTGGYGRRDWTRFLHRV